MTQEIIDFNGFKAHIDIVLIGGDMDGKHFRYAINLASMARLRRIVADLEHSPTNHLTRITKLKARLAQLETMNAKIAAAALAYERSKDVTA